jgi:hypothetical protein
LLKKFWIGLYVFIGLLILVSRIAVPLWLSLRSGLKVSKVVRETDNVVSIYVTGRNLKRFNASGGQFFQWRFITPHWWWQAHPYSLSMKPIDNKMRITVKHLGDQSSSFQELLKPGTRVIAEGPYGVFTAKQRYTNAVTAFAAGIGVTPIRAMMDDLPKSVNITFIYRVSDGEHAPLRQELDAFAQRKGWEVVYLEGPREQHPMTVEYMSQYAPALLHSDIYICGPNGFMDGVIKMVTDAGVPEKRIHHESFAF